MNELDRYCKDVAPLPDTSGLPWFVQLKDGSRAFLFNDGLYYSFELLQKKEKADKEKFSKEEISKDIKYSFPSEELQEEIETAKKRLNLV